MKQTIFTIIFLVSVLFCSCGSNVKNYINSNYSNDSASVYMPNAKYTIYDAINMQLNNSTNVKIND